MDGMDIMDGMDGIMMKNIVLKVFFFNMYILFITVI
jgi:hypothetical protein